VKSSERSQQAELGDDELERVAGGVGTVLDGRVARVATVTLDRAFLGRAFTRA
jgi:hypothetical protein